MSSFILIEMGIKSTLHGRRFLSSRLVFQYDDEVLHPLKTKQHKPSTNGFLDGDVIL
jgi:hypothetical protein